MAQKIFRGLAKSQETQPADSVRDTRSLLSRFQDFIKSRLSGSIFLLILSVCTLIFPSFADLLFIIVLFLFWYAFFEPTRLAFKLPIYAKAKDPNNPKPGSNEADEANGIYYFGNDVNNKEELWFNNTDMRTHALIFGSTGSGKTEALISIAYNALIQGSGFIYVDGKGDNTLYAKLFSMIRSMGREDDVLVVNYMTGAQDIVGVQEDVLSNTLNPFSTGSSSMLSQLVVSLLDSAGGGASAQGGEGDMWKGRAISFIEALMRLLVYLRDEDYLLLDASLIRRYFVLDVLEELMENQKAVDHNGEIIEINENIPQTITEPMYNFLATLPGYQRKNVGKQSDKTYEQHGYVVMQLTRVFGSLADVYAHIMRTSIAEVNFADVVLNRRILIVLLPALEKSPDELSNLGKLIISSLKGMLAEGLGSSIQGEFKEVIESKPSTSKTPYLCILDEYGYYAVPGFAVVPAQARSLGFSVVFAGQDLPAFQKASKEEAASIFANTNIKIAMKLEDPTETWDFFNKTAGEAYVSVAKSYNLGNDGGKIGYRDTKEATIEKRARIDLMDLKDQREGEGHIFFKSQIIRANMFYANPTNVDCLRINQFLKVIPPKKVFINELKRSLVMKTKLKHQHSYQKLHGDFIKSCIEAVKMHKSNLENFTPYFVDCIDSYLANSSDDDASGENLNEADNVLATEPVSQAQAEAFVSADAGGLVSTDEQVKALNILFMHIPLYERLDSKFYDVVTCEFAEQLIDMGRLREYERVQSVINNEAESQVTDNCTHFAEFLSKYISWPQQVNKKDKATALLNHIDELNHSLSLKGDQ
ncbi:MULTISPECIES: type IV secretory system conjugative DNA transfer family protein [Cysteiniphilum]|uniref:type IV secretory system conjugative DNA transfer family protein n=1 Tax=Cysteiniphilum TaxID=2056696 RepID=UPI0017827785|nr:MULTISPECIES: TraM recognition domain-containing protein [Cysteiniphilum]